MVASLCPRELPDAHLLLLLVATLARAPSTHTADHIRVCRNRALQNCPKLAGMGYPLASEFFRNLKWNGFKIDRHIKRLFIKWELSAKCSEMSKTIEPLLDVLGSQEKGVREFLEYSLLGISASPQGTPYSHIDNLVWLLGRYAEKKGEESTQSYLKATE